MRRSVLAVVALTTGIAWHSARAEDGVVAYVDGRAVQTAQVRQAGAMFSKRLANVPAESRAAFLVGQVVDIAILSDAARRDRVAPPTVEADRDYARDLSAAQAMLSQITREAAPEDAAVRSAYDALKPQTEFRARHVLLKSEEDAVRAIGRIRGGEPFEDVARSMTLDQRSAQIGGELGWFTKDRVVPELGKAVAALSPGFLSEPVRTQFGWHVVQLEETRPGTLPSFEAEAPRLRQDLLERGVGGRIAALRSGADVRWVVPKPSGW
ncbi:peptidylprolyl isomerase [Methylobacterium radiotolerans]|uniref:peptidylprolyl isomerase n=1 Tax=Methylobacterium radiotolerans TaxID=31998 RepID=UPI0038CF5713